MKGLCVSIWEKKYLGTSYKVFIFSVNKKKLWKRIRVNHEKNIRKANIDQLCE